MCSVLGVACGTFLPTRLPTHPRTFYYLLCFSCTLLTTRRAGESFEFELLPAPRPAVRAVARPAPAEYAAPEETRDSDPVAAASAAAEARDPAMAASPPRPPPPPRSPRGVAALPKKDPAVFRGQYKQYLQARL